jgi:hypothetical protein
VVEAKRDERKDPPSALVLETKRAEEKAVLALSSRQERVAAEGRETPAKSQPIAPESHKHEPSDFKPETPVIRLEPIVDDALIADITPPRARSMDDASFGMSVQSGSGAFLVAAAVVISFAAGFGGGFVVGQFSRPSTEAGDVSHDEPVAAPQPTRAVVEDPKPIASTPPKTVAPISHQKAPSAAPNTARPTSASAPPSIAAVVAPQRTVPAVGSGRLVVRSTPAGADVMIDDQPSGVTPLTLGELAFGAHTIAVSHPGHDSRRQRVTLSERRPARSVAFKLRPTSEPAQATAATNTPLRPASEPAQATAATNTPLRPASEPAQATAATNTTGSLQVASRPSGAQVFVDDSLIGTTPFLLSNVETGSKRLRIELSGYKSWEKSVQIEPSARSRVSASLEP